MKKLNYILILMLSACATKEVQLVSEPQSTVYVGSDFSSEFEELGQTPMQVDLKKLAADNSFAYISFKAEGYDNYRVALPSKYNAGSVEVKLNPIDKFTDEELKEQIEEELKSSYQAQISTLTELVKTQQQIHQQKIDSLKTEYKEKSNRIFNKVIEVQNALHLKKLPKAAKALAELRVLDAPEGLVLTLEGNFEFISGKYSRAIASYSQALNKDPDNVELAGIIKELKRVVE